jgi:hypothetical protein
MKSANKVLQATVAAPSVFEAVGDSLFPGFVGVPELTTLDVTGTSYEEAFRFCWH